MAGVSIDILSAALINNLTLPTGSTQTDIIHHQELPVKITSNRAKLLVFGKLTWKPHLLIQTSKEIYRGRERDNHLEWIWLRYLGSSTRKVQQLVETWLSLSWIGLPLASLRDSPGQTVSTLVNNWHFVSWSSPVDAGRALLVHLEIWFIRTV